MDFTKVTTLPTILTQLRQPNLVFNFLQPFLPIQLDILTELQETEQDRWTVPKSFLFKSLFIWERANRKRLEKGGPAKIGR